MYYDLLRERVKYFKEDKRGVKEMCKIWDDIKKEGIQEGRIESKIEIAQSLYQAGILTIEQIEKFTGVSRTDFAIQLV